MDWASTTGMDLGSVGGTEALSTGGASKDSSSGPDVAMASAPPQALTVSAANDASVNQDMDFMGHLLSSGATRRPGATLFLR